MKDDVIHIHQEQIKYYFEELKEVFEGICNDYSELSGWSLHLDNAYKRAGACIPGKKRIQLSRHHIKLNTKDIIMDTLLHEIAHAIAWERHESIRHGAIWQSIAKALGATPKATSQFEYPQAPWIFVYRNPEKKQFKKLGQRFRKSKNVKNFVVIGKPESLGHVGYISRKEYEAWQNEQLLFEQVVFIQ